MYMIYILKKWSITDISSSGLLDKLEILVYAYSKEKNCLSVNSKEKHPKTIPFKPAQP